MRIQKFRRDKEALLSALTDVRPRMKISNRRTMRKIRNERMIKRLDFLFERQMRQMRKGMITMDQTHSLLYGKGYIGHQCDFWEFLFDDKSSESFDNLPDEA